MYVIREVLHCKPGRVREMVDKFNAISGVLKGMGQEPLRLLTDVTGEPFWTVVAEANVERIEDFFALEQRLMANETLRATMADYHDLIENGRITAPVKGATLIGNGPEAMTRISAIGNDLKLDSGIGTCGKNGQGVPVGVGQPTLRMERMTVGGTATAG